MSETPRTDEFQKMEHVASDWMWREHAKQLERELAEATKQRDELAKALKSLCRAIISEEPHGITGLLKRSEAFLSATKGGSHE
jgi:hypothetical protein